MPISRRSRPLGRTAAAPVHDRWNAGPELDGTKGPLAPPGRASGWDRGHEESEGVPSLGVREGGIPCHTKRHSLRCVPSSYQMPR